MSSANEHQCEQQPIRRDVVGTNNSKKKWYLLMSNPSKSNHLGTLLRCAAAFQCHQVLLVGYDKFNAQGSFGSHLFLDIVVFPSWENVHDYLRRGGDDAANEDFAAKDSKLDTKDVVKEDISEGKDPGTCASPASKKKKTSPEHNPVQIIGIQGAYGGGDEIFSPEGTAVYETEDSRASLVPPKGSANVDRPHHNQETPACLPHHSFPVHTRPFSSDVCFLLSKDKRGLSLDQARMCSGFVHVPHLSFGSDVLPPPPSGKPFSEHESIPTKSSQEVASPKESIQITQSSLLDTAQALSIVLHHFTAWAGYKERTFAENQKFVKDAKPNARRRLCRVISQNTENPDQGETSNKSECEDKEAMGAMLLFKGADA